MEELISLTSDDLMASSSIVKASVIPFRERLVLACDTLQNRVFQLSKALRNYRIKAESNVSRIRRHLGSTFDELQKISLHPNLTTPASLNSIVRSSQSVFNILPNFCTWYPYYWDIHSVIFCSTALTLSSFLNREVACAESIELPFLQPDGCWFLLSYPEERAVIKRREHVFNLVAKKYDLFLDDLDVGLQDVASALRLPQDLVQQSSMLSQSINDGLQQSKTII